MMAIKKLVTIGQIALISMLCVASENSKQQVDWGFVQSKRAEALSAAYGENISGKLISAGITSILGTSGVGLTAGFVYGLYQRRLNPTAQQGILKTAVKGASRGGVAGILISPYVYHKFYGKHAYTVEDRLHMHHYINGSEGLWFGTKMPGDPSFKSRANCGAYQTKDNIELCKERATGALVGGGIGTTVAAGYGMISGVVTARRASRAKWHQAIRTGLKTGISKTPAGALAGVALVGLTNLPIIFE